MQNAIKIVNHKTTKRDMKIKSGKSQRPSWRHIQQSTKMKRCRRRRLPHASGLAFSFFRRYPHNHLVWWVRVTALQTCCVYRQSFDISRTLVGNNIAVHSYVELRLHSRLKTLIQWIGQTQMHDEPRNIYVLGFGASNIRGITLYVYAIWYSEASFKS